MKHLHAGLLAFVGLAALSAPATAQRVDRIITFGDSYADDGNAFELGLVAPAIQPLYPTRRFTGGTNYIDTLSEILDVPVYNYAIGGARANPDFLTEVGAFVTGAGGVFPVIDPVFDEGDLVTISIGGNDARSYGASLGASVAGAEAAAQPAIAATAAGLDTLVAAGAPTISFLAGDTGQLPEIAANPAQAAIRTAYSTAFNSGLQTVLAGYAADGVMVHYLDLSVMLANVQANPEAYGINAITCPSFLTVPPNTTCLLTGGAGFLFYGDLLHPTSDGSEIIARYVAAQLQAPLTLQASSELALGNARQFGRGLTARLDLGRVRDTPATGLEFSLALDGFSREAEGGFATDPYDLTSAGLLAGLSYGFGNGVIGAAARYSRPKAEFSNNSAEARARSWQVGAYAGANFGGGFAQGYVGYGNDEHDIDRAGVVDALTGSPDGSHWVAGAKAGYLVDFGAVRVGPVVGVDYAKAKVDDYTETGDQALALNVGRISAKSMVGSIGAELRARLGSSFSGLQPYLTAAIEKELSGNGRTIRFSQVTAPVIVNSWEFDDRSRKAYGRFAAGGSATLLGSLRVDALATTTVGRSDGDEVGGQVALSVGF